MSEFKGHFTTRAAYLLYHRQWRTENRDRLNTQARERRLNNIGKKSAQHRKDRYGVTELGYAQRVIAQDGRCAICREQPNHTLHIDHDHATGEIRELLCRRCNRALGLLKDDVEIYLEKHAKHRHTA